MTSARKLLSLAFGLAALLPGSVFAQATPPSSPAVSRSYLPGALPGAPRGGRAARGGGGGATTSSGVSGGDLILDNETVRRSGPIPEFHLVKKRDTLWGICQYYYGDPWSWPQLWAHNKSISNPHWIYPGDKVRLLAGTRRSGRVFAFVQGATRRYEPGPVTLRQHGFVDEKEIEEAGKIVGSKQEHMMLSLYHEVYIKGAKDDDKSDKGKRLKLRRGVTYTIYKVLRSLKSGKKKLGRVVEILGSVRIKRINKKGIATGEIVEALNEISRGSLVGPLRRTFKRLPTRPARKDLAGRVVDYLRRGVHVAQDDLVFINRGKNQGVRVGNRFLVMERGDGYRQLLQLKRKDQPNWPREAIAEVSVLDVREDASVGLITRSLQEVRKGDYVRMRRGY